MTVDDYIHAAPAQAQALLEELRRRTRKLCPDAEETVSYRVPALRLGKVFFYYAAFKGHIGIYPPVKGPAALVRKLTPYRGLKGNLQFPYANGLPFDLVEEVILALHKAHAVTK